MKKEGCILVVTSYNKNCQHSIWRKTFVLKNECYCLKLHRFSNISDKLQPEKKLKSIEQNWNYGFNWIFFCRFLPCRSNSRKRSEKGNQYKNEKRERGTDG